MNNKIMQLKIRNHYSQKKKKSGDFNKKYSTHTPLSRLNWLLKINIDSRSSLAERTDNIKDLIITIRMDFLLR